MKLNRVICSTNSPIDDFDQFIRLSLTLVLTIFQFISEIPPSSYNECSPEASSAKYIQLPMYLAIKLPDDSFNLTINDLTLNIELNVSILQCSSFNPVLFTFQFNVT